MVFSSLSFLFLFLPIVVVFYHYLLRSTYGKYALAFVFVTSLFFYAYWKPWYCFIILFSIVFNYSIGQSILKAKLLRKALFICGLSVNILLLAYFKYTAFLLETINSVAELNLSIPSIVLPIGISFYTFQQIAYLTDIYTKKYTANDGGFLEYATFVCFFPQLIAGPIVHHEKIMPQFAAKSNKVLNWKNVYIGLCFLSMGLAKKVLVADTLAPLVNYSFDEASSLTFVEAVFGCFAYILQVYYDFSGYADMAIGCGYFFNIKLPYNFNSPFKSTSISEFWQRWNITLSLWMRTYIYFPLGGSKKGTSCTILNLLITFFIGGLWHGAGWMFILWGLMHGFGLVVHRIWSNVLGLRMWRILALPLTFLFVSFVTIALRVMTYERFTLFIQGFLGYNGFEMRTKFIETISKIFEKIFGFSIGYEQYGMLMLCFLGVTLICKNSQEIILSNLQSKVLHLFIIILLLFSITILVLSGYSPEFIYFNF